MQDAALILYRGVTYNTYDHTDTITSNTPQAALTDSASNTGFKLVAGTGSPGFPLRGLWLVIDMPGNASGQITTTGAPTDVRITFTLTFSDDGSTTVGETITSKTVIVTITANAGTAPGRLYMKLGWITHKYIKVAWATTFTAGTTPTAAWQNAHMALVQNADTLVGTDIG